MLIEELTSLGARSLVNCGICIHGFIALDFFSGFITTTKTTSLALLSLFLQFSDSFCSNKNITLCTLQMDNICVNF